MVAQPYLPTVGTTLKSLLCDSASCPTAGLSHRSFFLHVDKQKENQLSYYHGPCENRSLSVTSGSQQLNHPVQCNNLHIQQQFYPEAQNYRKTSFYSVIKFPVLKQNQNFSLSSSLSVCQSASIIFSSRRSINS